MASAMTFLLAAVSFVLVCASACSPHSHSISTCVSPHSGSNSTSTCVCLAEAGPQGFCPASRPQAMSMVNHGLLTRIYATSSSSLLASAPVPVPYPCKPEDFANLLLLVCSESAATELTEECCSTILQVDGSGGLPCLCATASGPEISDSGFTVADVVAWYASCGGRTKVNPSDITLTCSGQEPPQAVAEERREQQQSWEGSSQPPPVTLTQPAVAARPLVVDVPYKDGGWPWWGVLVAVVVVMAFVVAMTFVCTCALGHCLRWLADYVMWIFGLGRRAGANDNQRARGPASYSSTNTSVGRELVPETELSDLPSTRVSELRDMVPTRAPEPGGPRPTRTTPQNVERT